jgi:hypothetical protein
VRRPVHGVGLALMAALVFAGCGGKQDVPRTVVAKPALNIILVADLSDRVDAKQIERDSSIIASAVDAMVSHARLVGFPFAKDRIRFQAVRTNQVSNDVVIDLRALNQRPTESGGRKPLWQILPDEKERFLKACMDSYHEGAETQGADIWGFFKDRFEPLVEGPPYVNKVILLTDGYLNFDTAIQQHRPKNTQMRMAELRRTQDWQARFAEFALVGVGKKFEADIMVLEVAPRDPVRQPQETEMLERYWREWAAELGMDIKHNGVKRLYLNTLQISAINQKMVEFMAPEKPQPQP